MISWADELRRYREAKRPDPQLCLACDGTGLDEASGDGWWNQDRCAACGGDGYCVEREVETQPLTRAEYDAQQAEWATDERRAAR